MAAGPLRGRIRRILGLEDDPMLVSGKSLAVVMGGLLLGAMLIVLNLPSATQATDKTSATAENDAQPEESQSVTVVYTLPPEKMKTLAEWLDSTAAKKKHVTLHWAQDDSEWVIEAPGEVHQEIRELLNGVRANSSSPTQHAPEAKTTADLLAQYRAYQDLSKEWPPKEITFQSQQDRDTATLAWYLLQDHDIRLMPATDDELKPIRERGFQGGLKVVRADGRPSILTQLQDKKIASFEDLRDVLARIVRENPEVVRFRQMIGSEEFDFAILRQDIPASTKFPTLAEQKLADLVWKQTGLELEPLGEKDLQRVKALGYEGGLRVTYGSSAIKWGDLLVGLHIWPTTNLKEVAAVLTRPDLAELSPLKFYVVRRKESHAGLNTPADQVVTGRIDVQPVSPPVPYTDSFARSNGHVELSIPHATVREIGPYTASSGEAKPSDLRFDGKTFDEWRTEWRTELSTEKRLQAVQAIAAFGASGYGKEAAAAIIDVAGQYDWRNWLYDDGAANKSLMQLQGTCIDAFTGELGLVGSRIPKEEALAALLAGAESPNPRTREFVLRVIGSYRNDPRVAAAIVAFSRDEDQGVQRQALRLFSEGWLQQPDDVAGPMIDRLREELRSDEPWRVQSALANMINSAQWGNNSPVVPAVPEFEELLFDPNVNTRQLARKALRNLRPADVPAMVDRLLAIVDDKSRSNDRREAVRALAAMGAAAKPAQPRLQELVNEKGDHALSASVALYYLEMAEHPERPATIKAILGENSPDGYMDEKIVDTYLRPEMDKINPDGNPMTGGGMF